MQVREIAVFEDIEDKLGNKRDVIQLLRYLGSEFPDYPGDLIRWLCPNLDVSSREDERLFHRWISQHALSKRPRDSRSIKRVFDLLSRIADRNGIADYPWSKVPQPVTMAVGPYFNRQPDKCISLLAELRNKCSNQAVRMLLDTLLKHYEDVLDLGRELKNDLRRSGNT